MRPGKKLHAPVGVPPSGLLTSLRLLVQCLPPATTRRTGGGRRREKKGKEGRRKREREGKGEEGERRKEEGRRGKWEKIAIGIRLILITCRSAEFDNSLPNFVTASYCSLTFAAT